MTLKQIVSDIKAVKIQGAQNIAFAALEGLSQTIHRSRAKDPKRLFSELAKAKELLDSARATEPLLQNYTSAAITNIDKNSLRSLRESVLKNIAQLKITHRNNYQHIIDIGEQKVRKGSVIFTHCHSSTVTGIIKKAHKQKKRVMVVNTEARPLYQGRITAKELAKAGILVHHYVDSAAPQAMEFADMVMIGADAITKKGVANKVGSRMFAKLAHQMGVPVYVCAHALKMDKKATRKGPKIEQRDPKEVWNKAPRKVKVENPAFDMVDAKDITGIISELGIFSHKQFLREVKKRYRNII